MDHRRIEAVRGGSARWPGRCTAFVRVMRFVWGFLWGALPLGLLLWCLFAGGE